VKLGKNASDTCVMLSEAYGGDTVKKSHVLNGVNGSKRACISKFQMKTVLITFFNIKGIVYFEFIPQGQTVNQAYYVETLRQLCEAVHRKRPEL
jgi:hypothetical protein